MNKNFTVVGLLLAVILICSCAPVPLVAPTVVPTPSTLPPTPIPPTSIPPTATTSAGLTDEQLKNATYQIPDFQETVTLQDGRFQRQDDLNPLDVYLTNIAHGDLNGDGMADAVVLLAVNTGGSGTFIILVSVLNQDEHPVQAGSLYIDDRAVTKRLEIKDGRIEYDVVVHQANDPLVSPSLEEARIYQLEGSVLMLTRLESQTSNGQTRKIVIDRPQNGDLASEVVQVQGSMPIGPFENNLAYRLYDAAGKQIDAQPFGVQASDPGAPAVFDNPVSLPTLPKGTVVWLELAELSMADGTQLAVTRVRLLMDEPQAEETKPTQPGQALLLNMPTMVDASTGWAVDGDGHMLRTTDGGRTWRLTNPTNKATAGFFLDSQTAWAYNPGDPSVGLVQTTDGGQTWQWVAQSLPFDAYAYLSFDSSTHGWAELYDVGAGNAYIRLFETQDSGATWAQIMLKDPDNAEEQPGVLHLCNICGDYFYYDASRMLIIYGELANNPAGKLSLAFSTDHGQTWKKSDLALPDEKYAASLVAPQSPVFFNEKDGVLPFGLVGSNPDGSPGTNVLGVYTTSDGGDTWLTSPDVLANAGGPSFTLQVLSSQVVFSTCGKGLCVTQDTGQTWQNIESNLNFTYDSDTVPYVTQFHFINTQVGWAHTDLGGQPGLWRTSNGGKDWMEIQPVLSQ